MTRPARSRRLCLLASVCGRRGMILFHCVLCVQQVDAVIHEQRQLSAFFIPAKLFKGFHCNNHSLTYSRTWTICSLFRSFAHARAPSRTPSRTHHCSHYFILLIRMHVIARLQTGNEPVRSHRTKSRGATSRPRPQCRCVSACARCCTRTLYGLKHFRNWYDGCWHARH